jgi:hypothetical protein
MPDNNNDSEEFLSFPSRTARLFDYTCRKKREVTTIAGPRMGKQKITLHGLRVNQTFERLNELSKPSEI